MGFTTTGVVAGSIAAGIQSGIGSVAAGSAFAGCQSLGALGLGVCGAYVIPIAVGAGVVYATVYLIKRDPRPKL